jgi:hypothetical protein
MRAWKLAIPSAILGLGFLFCGTATYGKPEYAKKESKKCVDCHTKMGAKDLNAYGQCYKDNDHSLAKCKQ